MSFKVATPMPPRLPAVLVAGDEIAIPTDCLLQNHAISPSSPAMSQNGFF
jgi:hypothetical protein